MSPHLPGNGRTGFVSSAIRWLVVGLLLSLVATVQATDIGVQASLDRNHAQLGDTVTLTVKVTGSLDASQPDFSALSSDFKVLGTSRSSNVSVDHGRVIESTNWVVQLQPKRVGTLEIPSLNVAGHATAPTTLVVSAAPTTALGGPDSPLFVTMTSDIHNPYVGQQVTLNVRLFYAIALDRGSISVPHADGFEVRGLDNSAHYQSVRDGRQYDVVEQHYALIPQHAGKIVLPSVLFKGIAVQNSGLDGFFGTGRFVQARSKSLDFEVRPRPAGENKDVWLPAREVTLSLSGLPADGHVQIGEPLTLTLTEKAIGLPFESLPTPTLPKLSGADVYPDRPHGRTSSDGNWLHGVRTRAFAVVPQKPGPLTIPEITLHWWNVNADKADDVSIPARTLTVTTGDGTAQPANVVGSTAPATNSSSLLPLSASNASQVIVASPVPDSGRWRALALLALGLWVLTVIGFGAWMWWHHRRLVRVSKPAPDRRLDVACKASFMLAVRNGDVSAQADALLAWARAERPQLHNLDQLAAALQSPGQRSAINALQHARYAVDVDGPTADALISAFAKGFQWSRATTARTSPLPPLYPG